MGAQTTSLQDAPTISDGIYLITSQENPQYNLDINGSKQWLQLYYNNYTKAQHFEINYVKADGEKGYYSIKSVEHNQNIGLVKRDDTDYNFHDYAAQLCNSGATIIEDKWKILSTGDDAYKIVDCTNEWAVTIKVPIVETQSNSTGVECKTYEAVDAAKWNFVRLDPIPEGRYNICNKANNDFCLTVQNKTTGGNVFLSNNTNANNQNWFVYYEDGYYHFVVAHSGMALDLTNKVNDPGTNIQQYYHRKTEGNDHKAQRWVIREADDNSYYIINSNTENNKVSYVSLHEGTAPAAEGTNVEGWSFLGGNAGQKWIFQSAPDPEGPVQVDNGGSITNFPTVNEAIEAAAQSGGTVKLLEEANIEGRLVSDGTWQTQGNISNVSSPVTVDLNGESLCVNGESSINADCFAGAEKVTFLLKDNGETPYANGIKITGTPIRYERTFVQATRNGKWQALYLPFAVTTAPTAYEFATPKSAEVSKTEAKLVVNKGVQSLLARTNYFVRTHYGEGEEKLVIEQSGATLLPYVKPTPVAFGETGFTICGSLKSTDNAATNNQDYWVLTNGGKFTWAKAGSHQRPYHWVIYAPDGLQFNIATMALFEEDGEETAIEDLDVVEEESNEPTYTIGGVRVNSANLAPGIYIRGGKKFIVR